MRLAEKRSASTLPEMPAEKRRRFVTEYELPEYDAGVLTLAPEVADYFETVARASGNAKAASNWVMTEVLRKTEGRRAPAACAAPSARRAWRSWSASSTRAPSPAPSAKDVFETMWSTGEGPRGDRRARGPHAGLGRGAIQAAIAEVIAASPDQVATYRKGKTSTLGWFVGQVMRKTGGQANPQLVNALLKKALEG